MCRLSCVALLCALVAGPLRAEQDASVDEVKAHAARAKVHYDLGEYERAADEYILAYRIKAIPALLYNIAQSYRQAGHYEKARQFYRSYLRETKEPKNRAAIEKAIREIDELLAKEKKAKNGPPSGVAQEPAGPTPGPARATAAPPLPALPAPQPAAVPASTQAATIPAATPRAAPVAATSTVAAPAVSEGKPFYKTWWFWTAAGVVAVGAGAAIALSGSSGPPSTHLGSTPVF